MLGQASRPPAIHIWAVGSEAGRTLALAVPILRATITSGHPWQWRAAWDLGPCLLAQSSFRGW